MSIECTSRLEAAAGDWLSAAEVRKWIDPIPDEAKVSQIIRDFGTQRDPAPTLVGLSAKWSENR